MNRARTAVLAAMLFATSSAWAVITRLTPLSDVLQDTPLIFMARFEKIDPAARTMTLVVDEGLKGKVSFARMRVALLGEDKPDGPLRKRLAPKLSLVVFASPRGPDLVAFAYTNGSWFQMTGAQTDHGLRWKLGHSEPYLHKTFHGSTAQLRQVIIDVLADKIKAPAPDPQEKPGLGLEVEAPPQPKEPEGETSLSLYMGPVFAVIPSVLIGGPLAILAMIVPVLCGALMLRLWPWKAALLVLSLDSTLCLIQQWLAPAWATPQAVWWVMAILTGAGFVWAWRRHRPQEPVQSPGAWETAILAAASLICVTLAARTALVSVGSKAIGALAGGLSVATLHALYRSFIRTHQRTPRAGFPTEAVFLGAMVLVAIGMSATFTQPTPAAEPVSVVWRFTPAGEKGWFASSPRVGSDQVWIGAALSNFFHPSGAVYGLDRASGALLWSFTDEGKMKPVFSSPCVADGRLYIGEGFHQDSDCKLYCLDAVTGKKLWDFQTHSHVESSAWVVNRRVYFGAGDDGLYCLDAAGGALKWHHQGLHVDASPLVMDGRVYGGSGIGEVCKETAVFCLDAASGRELWRLPTEQPVWAMPALHTGRLSVALGNGNFLQSAPHPAGGVLCIEPRSGRRIWSCEARDGVLSRVAADRECIYFVSRDAHCYCADAEDGAVHWKVDLHEPIVAAPALGVGPHGTEAVYVAGTRGRLVRLDAATGQVRWSFSIAQDTAEEAQVYSSPTVLPIGRDGGRRICLGCGLDGGRGGWVYCIEDNAQGPQP